MMLGQIGTRWYKKMLSNIIGFFASATPSVDWYTLAKGTAIEGGYFAGIVTQDDGDYAVIVAPKSSEVSLTFKTTNTATSGTGSLYNGLANTAAMNDGLHPAAQHCLDYSNEGYSDWYLPAKDELEVCYRYLKPGTVVNVTTAGANGNSVPAAGNYTAGNPVQTSAAAFQTGGAEAFSVPTYYWTSTESSASNAWVQRFSDGSQNNIFKTNAYLVRPVRRVKI